MISLTADDAAFIQEQTNRPAFQWPNQDPAETLSSGFHVVTFSTDKKSRPGPDIFEDLPASYVGIWFLRAAGYSPEVIEDQTGIPAKVQGSYLSRVRPVLRNAHAAERTIRAVGFPDQYGPQVIRKIMALALVRAGYSFRRIETDTGIPRSTLHRWTHETPLNFS